MRKRSYRNSRKKIWLESLSLNLWSGMSLDNWLELLSRASFKDLRRIPLLTLATTIISFLNSFAGRIERILYGSEVSTTEIVAPPIFIVGHWRTGTTHLHNLLAQDTRFTYPTTYTCMFPNHFLLSEWLVKRFYTLPETRPMDNIAMNWDYPQEDELALALLSGLSPYRDWAFPDRPSIYSRFLDFREATAEERTSFKKLIIYFVRKHTFRSRKRVVLKSPAHSFRIKLLTEIFPGAKFLHLYRDPITVFLSSVRMFSIVREQVGLTVPDNSRLEEKVIDDMLLCYRRIWEDKAKLAENQFYEMRFEDLEMNPIEELRKAYEKLELGVFEDVRSRMEIYLASISGYKKNIYDIREERQKKLIQKLAPIIKAYNY